MNKPLKQLKMEGTMDWQRKSSKMYRQLKNPSYRTFSSGWYYLERKRVESNNNPKLLFEAHTYTCSEKVFKDKKHNYKTNLGVGMKCGVSIIWILSSVLVYVTHLSFLRLYLRYHWYTKTSHKVYNLVSLNLHIHSCYHHHNPDNNTITCKSSCGSLCECGLCLFLFLFLS